MKPLNHYFVAAVLRLYPASFRERFADEMLAAFHDQLDAILARTTGSRIAAARFTTRTVFDLVRSLIPTYIAERHRAALVPDYQHPRTTPMQNFLTDVRYVLRTLRKQPGFALVAILTLALGIGANTAVFSVLDSVILAPLPYDEPEDLVRLYTGYRQNPGQIGYTTGPDIVEVRDQVDAFSSIGIMYTYREVGLDLTTDGPPRRIRALRISAEYFQTYRATPLLGRVFTRDEERRDVQRVVLSHHLWDAYAGRTSPATSTCMRSRGARKDCGWSTPFFPAWPPSTTAPASYHAGTHPLSAGCHGTTVAI